ncbi:AMP-binding protein [Aquibaculum arenosum]|uniref:AMP-binding protein n=1 Tax=Aquibaculum arenosum TaxID=3032591 RepID=A0ABT5YI64_9PROT|nr:AMP-binding protein [Fodinicurvata sp. CAU 1616]MDF2094597.1 AMP-binding protein [Fodinicurvata sp. CAU 1616]
MAEDAVSVIPARDSCVLRYMLEHWAVARPDADFVRFWPGEGWSYAETLARVQRRAAVLQREGVKQGDHVLCWMGNGPDLLTTWFAINYLGAVYIPINTAARGRPLAHILDNADARLMIAEPDFLERLSDIATGKVERILVTEAGDLPPVAGLSLSPLLDPDTPPPAESLALERPIEPWDSQAIMYTSGTTGPSKGVVFSYVQLYTMGPDAFDCIAQDDICMICGPIFHCGSTLYVYAMLALGGSMAMIREFKTGTFWQAVRETESSVVLLLGVMANFLLKAPPTPEDKDHPLRKAFVVPFGEDAPKFRDRFGVELYTVYNMTEIASPISAGPIHSGEDDLGLAGRPRPWFELRVADAHDQEVPRGEVGELLVRSHRPWALMKGYYRNAEATVEAMRNGWFHTGDAFRQDPDGRFFFVDRMKDVIRRRGENISSFELEAEVVAHPDVKEAVAVAVPSAHSEDEVLVVVTPVPGATIDPEALTLFLAERLPRFMVPRYLRITDDLPKTASGKLQKHVLRQDGVTADTWDREAAGLKLKR